MADTITITGIHPEVRKIAITLNVEGVTYPTVLPILSVTDADAIKAQLQDLAQELRSDFDALKAAVQATDANAAPVVSDAVTALVGQDIPVDTTPATPAPTGTTGTTPPATPAEGTTPPATDGGTTTAPATDGTTPTDAGSVAPGQETTPPATDGTTPTDGGTTTTT